MRILDTKRLLTAFQSNVDRAVSVDIAVAWASTSRAINILSESCGSFQRKPRVIVGTAANITTPAALRQLARIGELKVVESDIGIFHPKFYLFQVPNGSICWIGSPNFTHKGFMVNNELIHEFVDMGYAQKWFDTLWNELPSDTSAQMEKYIKNWKPRKDIEPRRVVGTPIFGHPLDMFNNNDITDWVSFISGLEKCDAYWVRRGEFTSDMGESLSVLGETRSYLDTISLGNLISRFDDWDTLAQHDYDVLLGHRDKKSTTGYGLLGSTNGAGTVCHEFQSDVALRRSLRSIVRTVQNSPNNAFAKTAGDAVERICRYRRFGPSFATRLIALSRPDRAVSVNTQSAKGLARLSGLSRSTLSKPQNYAELLNWIGRQPWHAVARPANDYEGVLWDMRAALLDSFVVGF